MLTFKTFLEKSIRNPLRKQELQSQGISHVEDPSFRRDKISKAEYELLMDKFGIKFFMPKNEYFEIPRDKRVSLISTLNRVTTTFVDRIRDVLPNRKPRIIIKDISRDEFSRNPYLQHDEVPPAFKRGNIIYIDPKHVSNVNYLVHEYAHYLADKIPDQTTPLLQREYRNMLDNYFRSVKKKKRETLELPSDEKLREKIAAKLGLPSEYAFVNPDEFFAEIITLWKKIPNNTATYKFKQAVKQVLSRL